MKDLPKVMESLALSVFGGYLVLVLGAGAGYFLGVGFGYWWWALYAAGAIGGAWVSRRGGISRIRRSLPPAVVVLLAHAVLVLAASGLASRFLDVGWDSIETHQRAVALMREGWNILDPQPDFPRGQPEDSLLRIPPEVFPQHLNFNGMYVVSTLFSTLPGGWEGGKGYRLLLLPMLGVLSAGMLRRIGLGAGSAVGAGFLVAANPVALFQLWTLFMDFDVAVFSSLAIVGLYSLSWRGFPDPGAEGTPPAERRHSFTDFRTVGVTGCAVLLLLLAKSSGILLGLPLGGLLILWIGWETVARVFGRFPRTQGVMGAGRRRFVISGIAITVLVASCGVGIVLAVDRFSSKIDPRYSLEMVKQAVIDPDGFDVGLGLEVPGRVAGLSRPEQFGRSLFEKTGVYRGEGLKMPFTWSESEWSAYRKIEWPGHGSGGFGPFFSGVLVLALVARLLMAGPLRRNHVPGGWFRLLLFASLLALCFILPSWWARWVPFVWTLPLFLLLPPLYLRPKKGVQRNLLLAGRDHLLPSLCAFAAISLGLLNAGLVLGVSTDETLLVGDRIDAALESVSGKEIALDPGRSLMVKRWLYERDIEYRLVREDDRLLFQLEPTTARLFEASPNP